MKSILELFSYTFKYRTIALLVILFNILYVIFNLISMALFVPFLQVLFKETSEELIEPVYSGHFTDYFTYIADSFNYKMGVLANDDPKGALF